MSPADKVRKEQRAEEARVAEGGARARARAGATTGGPAPVMRAATASCPKQAAEWFGVAKCGLVRRKACGRVVL